MVLVNFHSSVIIALKIVLTLNKIGVITTQLKIEAVVTEIFSQKLKEANYRIKNQHQEEALLGEEAQVEEPTHQEYILVAVASAQEEVLNLVYEEIAVWVKLVDSTPTHQLTLLKNPWDMELTELWENPEITWVEDLITLLTN